MLEYSKIILPKVSFSRHLFKKELNKCAKWVDTHEVKELYKWCDENFGDMYPDILEEVFADVAA
ncbi:MAG: hypothetical protein ACOC11_02595 [Prolixibacteraceae bacterium]